MPLKDILNMIFKAQIVQSKNCRHMIMRASNSSRIWILLRLVGCPEWALRMSFDQFA